MQDLGIAPGVNGSPGSELDVLCVGPTPEWLDLVERAGALDHVSLRSLAASAPAHARESSQQVIFLTRAELGRLRRVRIALPHARVVLDLSGEGDAALSRRDGRRAARADLILVGSLWELREARRRYPALARRTTLFRRPIDVDSYARRAPTSIGRFRRLKGLSGRVILFAGPFTDAGGLDVLLQAAADVRKRKIDAVVVAIPEGPVEKLYTRRLRRHSSRNGGELVVVPSVTESERASWYAAADLVCLPCRDAVSVASPKLAAAAGKPFVGSEIGPLLEYVDDGETGFLLPVGDRDVLVAALDRVLRDEVEAARLGRTARRKAEEEHSPFEAGKRLLALWNNGASPR